MKKKLLIIILVMFIGIMNVNAELEITKIENYYINYNGVKSEFLMFKDSETNKVLFSMSPYQTIKDFNLESKNFSYNLFPEQDKSILNDIQDILYLGYGNSDHTDLKWYLLSQYLLWQKLGYDMDIQDNLGNSVTETYYSFYNEYLALIENFKILPSYFSNTIDINYGEKYLLEDLNNVIEEYILIPYTFVRIESKDGQKYLYGKQPIKSKLGCYRSSQLNGNNTVYFSDDLVFINVVSSSKQTYEVDVNIHGGKIKIINVDENNKPVENSVYKLYNSNNKFIRNLTTNTLGEAITDYLLYDDYYLIESYIDELYVSNTEKIDVEFVDYGISEILIKSRLVEEEIQDDIINDNNENIEVDEDEKIENIVDDKKEDDVFENENVMLENPITEEENTVEESDKEIEFVVPQTKLDLTKYIILGSILLLLIGCLIYVKKSN